MRVTRRMAMAAGAALLAPRALAQQRSPVQRGGVPTLPIWQVDGAQIMAEAAINGEPVVAMFDNSPAGVLLSRAFARERRLESDEGRTPAGVAVQTKRGQKLKLAGMDIPLDAALIDLDGFETADGRPVALIVGQPVLDRMKLLFDFDAGIAHVQRQGRKPEIVTPSGMTVIRMLQQAGQTFPTMDIAIEGTPVKAFVRLGGNAPLTVVDGPMRERWFSGGRPWSSIGSFHQGVIGSAESKDLITTVSSVQVGPYTLRDVPLQVVAPNPALPAAGIGQPSAMIGAGLLSRFLLMYDARGLELGFRPGAKFGDKFAKNLVGLGVKAQDGGLVVMHVGQNGPAEAAGFRAQEIITAINGAAPVRAAMSAAKAGDRLEFTLAGGDKRIVEAREYY